MILSETAALLTMKGLGSEDSGAEFMIEHYLSLGLIIGPSLRAVRFIEGFDRLNSKDIIAEGWAPIIDVLVELCTMY